jgi:hypothetical protein
MTGIVKVSFQSEVQANQAVNKALVGQHQGDTGPGPFRKVNTGLYLCDNAGEAAVVLALKDLALAIETWKAKLDFVSVSITRL